MNKTEQMQEWSTQFGKEYTDRNALSYEEMEQGLNAVSSPIFDHEGIVVAGISVSGPSYRFSQDHIGNIVGQVMQTALQISREIGYAETQNDLTGT